MRRTAILTPWCQRCFVSLVLTACGRKDPVKAAMIAAKPPWPDQCHRFWPLNSFWIYRTSQRCARGACKALREHLWPRVHGSVVMCGNGVFTAFACMPLYNFVGEHLWTTRWSGSSVYARVFSCHAFTGGFAHHDVLEIPYYLMMSTVENCEANYSINKALILWLPFKIR